MPAVLDSPMPKLLGQKRGSSQMNGSVSTASLERDHLLVINDASWGMYLDLDSKFEGSNTRLTYLNRRIDIMTLSADHERIKGNLSHIIAAHCFDEEIEFVSHGAATLRIPSLQGKEPDDSFIFGTEKKPTPDMVLEIVLTTAAIDKLAFYAPLRIPEVWVWDSSGLGVFVLEGTKYRKARKSRLLPRFDISLAGSLATSDRASQAVKEYRRKAR
jgi:Uma2 family endonuclease